MITFIGVCHNEKDYNMPLAYSLLAQTNPNWKLILYNNGPRSGGILHYADDRIIYTESLVDTGMWGCANRAHAVRELVDTPYVINTSAQDYYIANAVQEITDKITEGADLICWKAINHLFRYSEINGELAWGHIDWGQWCTKTDYIKQTGIVQQQNFSGDWHTLQAIIQKGLIKNHRKVEKVLTVHN